MQNKFAGFALLEILIVLLLISILGSMVVPAFMNKKSVVKKQFIADFTTLIQETLFRAIVSKKTHQIIFDFEQRTINAKEYDPNLQSDDIHKKFNPTVISKVIIPKQLEFINFYINEKDEIQPGKIIRDAWFYIMPDGTSQPILLNIEHAFDNNSAQFSLSVNPFYSQVQEHETFQKI